jgi:hypothetical protein
MPARHSSTVSCASFRNRTQYPSRVGRPSGWPTGDHRPLDCIISLAVLVGAHRSPFLLAARRALRTQKKAAVTLPIFWEAAPPLRPLVASCITTALHLHRTCIECALEVHWRSSRYCLIPRTANMARSTGPSARSGPCRRVSVHGRPVQPRHQARPALPGRRRSRLVHGAALQRRLSSRKDQRPGQEVTSHSADRPSPPFRDSRLGRRTRS